MFPNCLTQVLLIRSSHFHFLSDVLLSSKFKHQTPHSHTSLPEMGFQQKITLIVVMVAWTLLFTRWETSADANDGAIVNFLKVPPAFSSLDSALFSFDIPKGGNAGSCKNCTAKCKLDNHTSLDCGSKEVSYTGLLDGLHTFEVCVSGAGGINCATHNWTVDTVPPTAHLSVDSPFTNASNVSVGIYFSEPCTGGRGFQCSTDNCNLLVYGAGAVMPSTLKVIQPDLVYSVSVAISIEVQYGRLVLVMDRGFCTDTSGNRFTRTTNSSFFLHFDRRNVYMNVTTRVPKKLLLVDNKMRTVVATNTYGNLKIYLHFSSPVTNSSAEIQGALQVSNGILFSDNKKTLGNRRFGFFVRNVSRIAVISISLDTSLIISRQGTPVSPTQPTTFLYDAEKPSVLLTTSALRTRERMVSVVIKFAKPVFNFNSSSLHIYGGYLQGFNEISQNIYTMDVQIVGHMVAIKVPKYTTKDVAGNRNLESNLLQVRHYSIPIISSIFSSFTTGVFVATAFVSLLLSISTGSLLFFGALPGTSSSTASEPSRNLMRIAFYIQVFALSKWLVVNMPIEYFEFSSCIEWSIPYLSLPWETKGTWPLSSDSSHTSRLSSGTTGASKLQGLGFLLPGNSEYRKKAPKYRDPFTLRDNEYGAPLTAMEYRTYFENVNMKPEAEVINISRSSNRWPDFGRNMFWLALIGGALMVSHLLILFLLKLRTNSGKNNSYGALAFPRFEIFLAFLALPCVCQASASIIKGGSTTGAIVGSLMLGITSIFLLFLLLFLTFGIIMGDVLRYKEVNNEGQTLHWYQSIMCATLGPRKRGQWAWNDCLDSINLLTLGPFFEDLRGPPKPVLNQPTSNQTVSKCSDTTIASESVDAEAPLTQNLFSILRIYYTFVESVKRTSIGIVAGLYSSENHSNFPILLMLSVTSFQLFFLVLKKPFIKRRVQFVETISMACEVGLFGTCLFLSENHLSESSQARSGIFMLALFLVGFFLQMANEWFALFRQVLRLSPDGSSFCLGLRTVLTGVLLIFLPSRLLSRMVDKVSSGETGSTISSGSRIGGSEVSWARQLRQIAKDSFNREDKSAPKDPSSSSQQKPRMASK